MEDTAAAEVAVAMVVPGLAAAVMPEVETLLKLTAPELPDAIPEPRPQENETAEYNSQDAAATSQIKVQTYIETRSTAKEEMKEA